MNRKLIFKNFTIDLARLSKCTERKVAAIITDNDLTQVYSIGVNGGPKGLNEERKNKLVSYLYNKMKEASE